MRLPKDNRRSVIVAAGVAQANELGLCGVTQETVASRCAVPCSVRTVRRVFPQVTELWRAVAESGEVSQSVIDEARILGVWKQR